MELLKRHRTQEPVANLLHLGYSIIYFLLSELQALHFIPKCYFSLNPITSFLISILHLTPYFLFK